MGRVGCSETSVSIYHSTLRDVPEECRCRLCSGTSLKPPIWSNLTIRYKFSIFFFFFNLSKKEKKFGNFYDIKYVSQKYLELSCLNTVWYFWFDWLCEDIFVCARNEHRLSKKVCKRKNCVQKRFTAFFSAVLLICGYLSYILANIGGPR